MTHNLSQKSDGPPTLIDMCPGVGFFQNQNITDHTVLQVNQSLCDRWITPMAHAGVAYVPCDAFTSKCVLHVRVASGFSVRARVRRLAYWCETSRWVTRVRLGHMDKNTFIRCSHHSLEDMIFESRKSAFLVIEHDNYPAVKINIEAIEHNRLVKKYISEYSCYMIAPLVSDFFCHKEELKIPSQSVIIISVQQSCYPTICAKTHLLNLIYRKPDATQEIVTTMCKDRATPATILVATHLEIRFRFKKYFHTGLKIQFSVLDVHHSLQNLPSGLFNCSTAHYFTFQPYLNCNLKRECEDGRDETEHCPFSSPGCQGLVASRNKCFHLFYPAAWLKVSFMHYGCGKFDEVGLASLKTRLEQDDALQVLENYRGFQLMLGYTSGWNRVPFLYSKFRTWSDKTLIYRMDHFVVSPQYLPARAVKSRILQEMALMHEKLIQVSGWTLALCETAAPSFGVFSSQAEVGLVYVTWSGMSNTRQCVFVCPRGHVTHTFLKRDPLSHCCKTTYSQFSSLANDSDQQNTAMNHNRGKQQTYATFICNDATRTIHQTLLCDFRQDCPDHSDESFCDHPPCDGFLCSNGQCVRHSQRCNEFSDCADDSDEVECPEDSSFHLSAEESDKKLPLHINLDGTGYFSQQQRKSDHACHDSHYQCLTEWLYCLPVYTRCNGFSDCIYGEDEQGCETAKCLGFFACRDSVVCVHKDHLCDGWGQCPQRDDELMCDTACPDGCLCQGHSFRCSIHFPAVRFPHLRHVDASHTNMQLTDFTVHVYLTDLTLSSCSLENISCTYLPNLHFIDLSHNRLPSLDVALLHKLPNLKKIHLANNALSQVTNTFLLRTHFALTRMDISNTCLSVLNTELSIYLPALKHLNASLSTIESVGCMGFKNMPQLVDLDLRGNVIRSFPMDLFSKSHDLKRIFSSNFRFCCENLFSKESNQIYCKAPDVTLPSCVSLLPSDVYRLFFWFAGILALLGNALCFLILQVVKELDGSSFLRAITHFLFANVCMGINVTIAVLVNEAFDGQYIFIERRWTNSATCKVSGFLFSLSSQVSVWILGVITMDHAITLCFPRGAITISLRAKAVVCTVVWLASMMMSSVPFLPGLSHLGLNGQSGLCRLALFNSGDSNHEFRWFTVITNVNFVMCLLIASGQFLVYSQMPKYRIALSAAKKPVYSSVRLIRKVIFFNVVCWLSFSLVTMVKSARVSLSEKVHGAMVVFVLPLSSAISPLLFIWAVVSQQQAIAREMKVLRLLKSQVPPTGKNL